MRVSFGRDNEGQEFVAFGYAAPPALRLHDPAETVPEVMKALGAPALKNGQRVTRMGRFTVPQGARWFWAKIANEGRDLTGEVTDIDTLRKFAKYTVTQAGWVDLEHWSRPGRFPPHWLQQGVSPQDFILGKITDLRFSPEGDVYAEAFLWPKGRNPHADRMWQRMCDSPESIHASVAGSPLSRDKELGPDGRERSRLKLLMNSFALTSQGINPNGTEVSQTPVGEFLKAMADGVSIVPDCDGDTCVACFVRGDETHKAVTAGGPAGINAAGNVPQDIEGFRARALRGTKPCPTHCNAEGVWRSDNDAAECLKTCHGLDKRVAAELVSRARKKKEASHVAA